MKAKSNPPAEPDMPLKKKSADDERLAAQEKEEEEDDKAEAAKVAKIKADAEKPKEEVKPEKSALEKK
jgi:hypothetical protein